MDRFRSINPEQIAALLRTIGQVVGGIVATRGYMTEDQWMAIFGGLSTIILTAWGMWARSDKNLVKSAAEVPVVEAIVAPATKMANSPDHPKIVPTPAAAEVVTAVETARKNYGA